MAATFSVKSFPLLVNGQQQPESVGPTVSDVLSGFRVGSSMEVESRLEMAGRVRVLHFFTHHVETKAECRIGISVSDGSVTAFHYIVGTELVFFGDDGGYGVEELLRSTTGVIEFREKIGELGKAVHENLLPFRGYCWHPNEILLVYDYVRMGSLAFRLHGNEGMNKASLT
ncbi:hypothetical protein K7X08_013374 [Anisodus acutangulus]|uniref:Uncharacterized protein n=1 Tax=Anisodus acutangulus TaxID=402998 RepID=A0A9Q1MG03_9SOLA|nr:hypothetical protein K7X08_013374 [Anisodus acutangulus]